METDKLFKYLAPYLPYGIQVLHEEHFGMNDFVVKKINAVNVCSGVIQVLTNHEWDWTDKYKLVLRPMSDLKKEIDGKIGLVELAKMTGYGIDFAVKRISERSFTVFSVRGEVFGLTRRGFFFINEEQDDVLIPQLTLFSYLFEHHYDIWGLIEQGLAIDINNLKEEWL